MSRLLTKLNHQNQLVTLVNMPAEMVDQVAAALAGAETTSASAISDVPAEVQFAIVFVRTLDEVQRIGGAVLDRAVGDAVVWFCYPKGSSSRYTCDFNRDTGWQALGEHGFEPVRQVAFDADWSALRFRNVAYIKTLTRAASFAVTPEGKRRTSGQGR